MTTPTSDRPLALVTGASSGIAAGKVIPDKLKSEQHRRMAEPGSGS
ncbi:hypothetical protein ABZU92_16035 [Micromonospora arida]